MATTFKQRSFYLHGPDHSVYLMVSKRIDPWGTPSVVVHYELSNSPSHLYPPSSLKLQTWNDPLKSLKATGVGVDYKKAFESLRRDIARELANKISGNTSVLAASKGYDYGYLETILEHRELNIRKQRGLDLDSESVWDVSSKRSDS